jgi:hypothetical protein
MNSSKGFYLDIENQLYVLITHYDLCEGSSDPEVIDWARFFVRWADTASKQCGPWTLECMNRAREIVDELERSQSGKKGYEALGNAMQTASRKLAAEIKGSLLSEMWK